MQEAPADTSFPQDPGTGERDPRKPRAKIWNRCCLAEAAMEGAGEAVEPLAESACCLAEAASGGDSCCLAEAASVVPDVGSCFVATAALRTDQHPDLTSLRSFRDRCLSTHWLGRLFIRFYYRWGRYPARAIQGRALPCWVVRNSLIKPAAWFARKFL